MASLALAPAHAQNVDGEQRELTFIGFQQYSDASRVFIRTNESVSYRIEDDRQDKIVVILENTGASVANHLKHLDTRFFDGPVVFVQPRLIEGASPSVEIEIHLGTRTPYDTLQNDNFLAIDFRR